MTVFNALAAADTFIGVDVRSVVVKCNGFNLAEPAADVAAHTARNNSIFIFHGRMLLFYVL